MSKHTHARIHTGESRHTEAPWEVTVPKTSSMLAALSRGRKAAGSTLPQTRCDQMKL